MAQARYQYETSPRKIEPDYTRKPKQRPKRKPLKAVENMPRQQIKVSKEQRKRQLRTTVTVVGLFLLLLTISCRNSQIDKQFDKIQDQKKQLAALQKENEQLNVSIHLHQQRKLQTSREADSPDRRFTGRHRSCHTWKYLYQ